MRYGECSVRVTGDSARLDLESLYRRMVLIRLFEDAVQRLFQQGEIQGTTHLYQGQEAVSVGVCAALREGDVVAATYRGHGACLAMGTDPTALMAELLGRETGVCRGRAGTMNVIDLEHGVIGCFGIVGGSIAAATGAGLASRLKVDGTVAVAFFGDGAVNQAYFHECLNFASVMALPVVFVCENNLYMEYTPIGEVTAVEHPAADRAGAYGLDRIIIDGNDADIVYRTAKAAYERARGGRGPSLIECMTYRHSGHSRADPAKYRPEGELDRWKQHDPIKLYRERLKQFGVAEEAIAKIETETMRMIDAATATCQAAPPPSMDILTTDVYADGGFAWRN